MTETTTYLLKMANGNNKLACEGFIQIHFAPRGVITEDDYKRVYQIPLDDGHIYAVLIDFARLPFNRISSIYTIPATGMDSFEWKKAWKQKYPSTKEDTMMAIYCYKRSKSY